MLLCRHDFLKKILQAGCKKKDVAALTNHTKLNELLARSPGELTRLKGLYPEIDSRNTAKSTTCGVCPQPDGSTANQHPSQPPETVNFTEGNVQSQKQDKSLKESPSSKQQLMCEGSLASNTSKQLVPRIGHHPYNEQADMETRKSERLARLEDIKGMVAAAEQQAMPAAEEDENLQREKRRRFAGSYKEPDGREFH